MSESTTEAASAMINPETGEMIRENGLAERPGRARIEAVARLFESGALPASVLAQR